MNLFSSDQQDYVEHYNSMLLNKNIWLETTEGTIVNDHRCLQIIVKL